MEVDSYKLHADSLSKAIYNSGWKYAEGCFSDIYIDEDTPLLADGRINPHWLSIEDAVWEILNVSIDDYIELDPVLFPNPHYSREEIYELIDLYGDEFDEGEQFLQGEIDYIATLYGEGWYDKYPDL